MLANLIKLPLVNKWFASAIVASGNRLPLANRWFTSGIILTAGKLMFWFVSSTLSGIKKIKTIGDVVPYHGGRLLLPGLVL